MLEVIALFTPPDRDAPFVRQADRAIELPAERGAVAAYLDHDGVIERAREVRADAVWPGWGFVAEDPVFVDRLAEAGIVFLGPSADAMRALGDKITSKQLAEKAGVPVTDWSGGALADEADALAHAERIGFPVVLKATAGGGGRGIRMVVEPDEDSRRPSDRRRSKPKAAFGNGALFVEAMVSGGRHIEVQVAADQHGHARRLRLSRLLRPASPPEGARGSAAARLSDASCSSELEARRFGSAQHVGYCGVGTVEFLLTGEDFFFLEVNPRLQVEHGITEEITGIDLVEIQIRIARGESIADIVRHDRGCALEARVCAEDPDEGFLPSPGRIASSSPPSDRASASIPA